MGRISKEEKRARLQAQLDDKVSREKALDAQIKALTEQKKALDGEIQEIMTEMGTEKQQSGLFWVHFRHTEPGQRFDYSRYQREHGDLCTPYMVTTPPGVYFRII